MHIAFVKRAPGISQSMDVYANHLIHALRVMYPSLEITEIMPRPWWKNSQSDWQAGLGLKKYYERYIRHPRNVARLDADIIHILDHTDAHIAKFIQSKHQKVVVTCHDLVQFVYPDILKDQSRWPTLSLKVWQYSVSGLLKADHIVSVSNNTKIDIIKYLGADSNKITTIANAVGADFKVLDADEILHYQLLHKRNSNEICLLNVGSTHSRKNILLVLQALRQLKNKNIPIRLWRVGGEFTEQQAAYIHSHGLKDDILDFGTVSDNELVKIYNAADILLAPSLYEGFGLTILEAMACGCPVITSNCSSLPEVAGDAAILLNPSDLEEIVCAIQSLINKKEKVSSYVAKGLTHTQTFSWLTTAEKVMGVYEKVRNTEN